MAPIRTLSLEKTTLTLGVESFFLQSRCLRTVKQSILNNRHRKLFKHFNLEKQNIKISAQRLFIYRKCTSLFTYSNYTLFFYKNIFYKNIEAEICEILRIF